MEDAGSGEGVGEKRKAADVSNDSQGGSAASAPAGMEALPSVGIVQPAQQGRGVDDLDIYVP